MTHTTKEFPWKTTAVAVIAFFLLGYAAQLALTMLDRGDLESVVQPSAVGDSSYFVVPEGIAMGDVLVTYEGEPLVSAAIEPERVSSIAMMRVGTDDSGALDLYQCIDEAEEIPPGVYFLKTAPRRFLRLGVQEAVAE